jgi:hypothetical protein
VSKTRERPVAKWERAYIANREVDMGTEVTRLGDHRRRQIQAAHLGTPVMKVASHVTRSAAKVAHLPLRASRELVEKRTVHRLSVQLVEEPRRVLGREAVIARRSRWMQCPPLGCRPRHQRLPSRPVGRGIHLGTARV